MPERLDLEQKMFTIYLEGGNTMKVNPKTVVFVLELVAALAVTASGVVSKYYIDVPQG